MMKRIAKETNKIDSMFKYVGDSNEKDKKKVRVKKKDGKSNKSKQETKDDKKLTPSFEIKLGAGIERILPDNLSDTGDSDRKDLEDTGLARIPEEMDLEHSQTIGKSHEGSNDQITKKVCKEIDKITLTELQQ